MSQHTPGEWKESRLSTHILDSEGNGICKFESKYGMYENYKANARLIAAAPDLLEALKQMDRQVMDLTAAIDLDDRTTAHACLDRLRAIQQAAIRKAEEGK